MVTGESSTALITRTNALIEISILIDVLRERLEQGGDVAKISRDLEKISSYIMNMV